MVAPSWERSLPVLESVMHDVASRAATNERDLMAVDGVVQQLAQLVQATQKTTAQSFRDVEQMAGRLQEAASQIEEVRDQATAVGQVAESSLEQAAQAEAASRRISQAMTDLQSHAEKILGLSDVIREIASTTNLLALNAAIEAARAGQYGRSFAVLAEEIRKLADQTRQQAQIISEDLDSMRQQLGVARAVSEEAGAAVVALGAAVHRSHQGFSVINQVISEAAREIGATAQLAQAQNDHMEAVAGTMNTLSEQFSQVSEQVHAITAEVQETARRMERGYEELGQYQYDGVLPTARREALAAAQEIEQVLEAAVASGRVRRESLLAVGQYEPYDDQSIRRLAPYCDVSQVVGKGKLDPPRFRVPYEDSVEGTLNRLVQSFISRHPDWILFSVVDLNGYVVACVDIDRLPLTGDPKVDDRNRFKRLLTHPTWVRGSRVGMAWSVQTVPKALTRAEFSQLGAPLKRPVDSPEPLVQTYIRNNVTVMTLLSFPLYVGEDRFGAVMIAWP